MPGTLIRLLVFEKLHVVIIYFRFMRIHFFPSLNSTFMFSLLPSSRQGLSFLSLMRFLYQESIFECKPWSFSFQLSLDLQKVSFAPGSGISFSTSLKEENSLFLPFRTISASSSSLKSVK